MTRFNSKMWDLTTFDMNARNKSVSGLGVAPAPCGTANDKWVMDGCMELVGSWEFSFLTFTLK